MLLPAQHEVNQKRNKDEREHYFRYGAKIFRDRAAPIFHHHRHWPLAVFSFVRKHLLRSLFKIIGLLADVREYAADFLGILGQFVNKADRAGIQEVAAAIDRSQQYQHR